MANPWFRMYAEFATDPKMQFMSEALQRRYVFALCVTCNGEIEKLTDDELAFAMRITPEEWAETKTVFIEKGLFNEDGRVKNWEKRQYKSDVTDPTNADRQKRYRENKRNGNVTGAVTEEKRPDTDTDKEKNKKRAVKKDDEKTRYADNVLMTTDEFDKLVAAHGEPFARACITKLSNSKAANGKTYKSDYRAILNWVVDAVSKNPPPAQTQRRFEL